MLVLATAIVFFGIGIYVGRMFTRDAAKQSLDDMLPKATRYRSLEQIRPEKFD